MHSYTAYKIGIGKTDRGKLFSVDSQYYLWFWKGTYSGIFESFIKKEQVAQRHFKKAGLFPLTSITIVKPGLSGYLCKLLENGLKFNSGHYSEHKEMSPCLERATKIRSPL